MSDEKVEAQPEERQHFIAPHTRNLIVGTALAVILLTITAWAGSVRTERAKRAALSSGVSALAASLRYPMLEANSVRSDTGRQKMRLIVLDIAEAGGYSAVYVTNADGEVIATTKGKLSSKKLSREALPSDGVKFEGISSGVSIGAPIKSADSVLGFVFVEKPND